QLCFILTDLNRCLGLSDLTFLSIGGMIGSGLYVLTGTVAHNFAGGSIVLSYLFAAIASALSAFCYAEFAARIPVTGSAYQFTYLSVGEFWAFVIGWNVLLEHAVSVSAVAKSLSGYFDSLIGFKMKEYLVVHTPMPGGILASYPDFFAAGIVIIVTIIVATGVKFTSRFTTILAAVNLAILVLIFSKFKFVTLNCNFSGTGMYLANINNWTTVRGGFFPHGFAGTISGASTLVFSYVGYEIVASVTEEAKNPNRDVPLALLISICVAALAYVGASAALTLMVPWYDIVISAPFPAAYAQRGWNWAKYVVSIGALAAMSTSIVTALVVVPRYVYAMASDGLIMPWFNTVNKTTGTPVIATVTTGIFCIVMALVFSLHSLVEFISIGQLLACSFVSFCVIKLRYEPNDVRPPSDTTIPNSTSMADSVVSPTDSLNDHCGIIKDSIMTSPFGEYFAWTLNFRPGVLPFYSLLLATLFGSVVSIMLLVGISHIKEAWFILLLVVFIFLSLFFLFFICMFTQDQTIKTYKVPFVPIIPFASIMVNIILMLKLQKLTWLRLAIWMAIGLIIYFGYGYRHSKSRK
uniref:Cationic amino acid transporter C-terminal domain-containing protein n=1 Tax=Ciona savignyi TaxID=51511 RepID=H2ZJP2_CIOSA